MKLFNYIVRFLFWGVFIRLLVLVVLGVNVRRRELLPQKGPAIIVANHNSHLDTMVLMSLYSLKQQKQLRPAAAADHFLRNRLAKWFSLHIIGIVPVQRKVTKNSNPLQGCYDALEREEILILYPEGSRGEPEQMAEFKAGVARLAEKYPHVPVVPVFMHGLGKALPKGDFVLVPFFCDVFVGEALYWKTERDSFMQEMSTSFTTLSKEKNFAPWE